MRAEVDQKDYPTSPPPLDVDSIGTLKLSQENIGTIIWASGYGYSFDWVKLPIFHPDDTPAQQRGVTACPGVYLSISSDCTGCTRSGPPLLPSSAETLPISPTTSIA
jgi:hypothetical protein